MTDVVESLPGQSSRMESMNPDIDLPDELDYGDDAPDAIPGKNLDDPVVDVIFT